jgi:hypothetical protein
LITLTSTLAGAQWSGTGAIIIKVTGMPSLPAAETSAYPYTSGNSTIPGGAFRGSLTGNTLHIVAQGPASMVYQPNWSIGFSFIYIL